MIRTLLVIIFGLAVTLTASNLNIWANEGEHKIETGEHKAVNIIGNIAGEESNKVKLQCPVMKTWFVPNEKTDKVVYEGKTYYFCCKACKPMFEKEPGKYIKSGEKT
jgi:YHS domain-containing protein